MNRFSKSGDRDAAAPPAVVDVHQHLWPEALIEALRARARAAAAAGLDARARRRARLRGRPARRTTSARARRQARRGRARPGARVAVEPARDRVAAPDEAEELLDAYHEGALAPARAVRRVGGGVPDRDRPRRAGPGARARVRRPAAAGDRAARRAPATTGSRRCSRCSRRPGGRCWSTRAPRRPRRPGDRGADDAPAVVAGDGPLRPADARGLVRVPRPRPAAPPSTAGVLRDAGRDWRRCTASGSPPAPATAPWSTRTCSSRSPRTAPGRSTPSFGCSAST